MLDKILIVDFEDSFTFNIANVLFGHESSLRVVGHVEFFSNIVPLLMGSSARRAIILGPGPGHPNDYQHYFFAIKQLQQQKNLYLMGICLGHQLLAKVAGHQIHPSTQQIHGQSVNVIFKNRKLKVQRYNSLAVFVSGKEMDVCHYPGGISYQFHPESIGTSDNDIFFEDLLNFIK